MPIPSLFRRPALLCCCLFLAFSCSASHYLGGQITYQNLGGNVYDIRFTYYYDCEIGDPMNIVQDNPVFYRIFSGNGGAPWSSFVTDSVLAISDVPLPVNSISPCAGNPILPCVRKKTFIKSVVLPPNFKYLIVNQRCCFTAGIANIIDPTWHGATISTEVPDVPPLSNSSAVFQFDPPLRLCVNDPFRINHSAVDADGDSLHYRLVATDIGGTANDAKPIAAAPPYATVSYTPSYSVTDPLGPSGTLSLDPATGIMNGICHAQGRYMIAVACDEYRNGQRIATSIRTYAYIFIDCNLEVSAVIGKDSLLDLPGSEYAGDSVVIARCGSGYTVQFGNESVGALGYHWDFGDPSTAQDTSSQALPAYTYPGPGRYKVRLVALGASCNDTATGYVILSDDQATLAYSHSGTLCTGDTMLLQDNSVVTNGNIRDILWSYDGHTYSGAAINIPLLFPGTRPLQHTIITEDQCIFAEGSGVDVRTVVINAGADTVVTTGTQLQLNAIGGAVTYEWQALPPVVNPIMGTGTTQATVFCNQPGHPVWYVVTGTDAEGCIGTDTIDVSVSEKGYVYVPTAFSPNGDGINDVLNVRLSGYAFVELRVFNRLGQQVFSGNDLRRGWDGTFKGAPAPPQVYVWMVRARNEKNEQQVFSGDVTLLR